MQTCFTGQKTMRDTDTPHPLADRINAVINALTPQPKETPNVD
jgi:hypothetical protein